MFYRYNPEHTDGERWEASTDSTKNWWASKDLAGLNEADGIKRLQTDRYAYATLIEYEAERSTLFDLGVAITKAVDTFSDEIDRIANTVGHVDDKAQIDIALTVLLLERTAEYLKETCDDEAMLTAREQWAATEAKLAMEFENEAE